MTFAAFRALVAAYMQRSESSFVVGSTNSLEHAINMARKWAEREHNFVRNRLQSQLTINIANGTDISGMVLASDGVTSVSVKALHKAFFPFDDGSGTFPVDIVSRAKHLERVQRHYEGAHSISTTTQQAVTPISYFNVVRLGDLLYVAPGDASSLGGGTTVVVTFDITKWLDDYSDDADTDFFLDECRDWLLLRTMWQLNFFLKEDVRVPVSQHLLNSAWHAVIAWDSNLVFDSAEDADLD